MNVVLDIDETLVHSIPESSSLSGTRCQSFTIPGYRVCKRPYVDEFLDHLLNDPWYQVGIWSAGSYTYVHEIVDNLIPDRSKLLFTMTLDDCNERRQKPLSKVLNLLNERSRTSISKDSSYCPYRHLMHDIIIIDDKHGVTGYNHLNHLKMVEYEGDQDDIELKALWEYLDRNRYHSSEYLVSCWK